MHRFFRLPWNLWEESFLPRSKRFAFHSYISSIQSDASVCKIKVLITESVLKKQKLSKMHWAWKIWNRRKRHFYVFLSFLKKWVSEWWKGYLSAKCPLSFISSQKFPGQHISVSPCWEHSYREMMFLHHIALWWVRGWWCSGRINHRVTCRALSDPWYIGKVGSFSVSPPSLLQGYTLCFIDWLKNFPSSLSTLWKIELCYRLLPIM